MTSLLEHALTYAGRGWPVLPCAPRGKRPLIRGGVHSATTDPETIRRWWSRWPEANIGLACGAVSGLVVIDVDGDQGAASLEALEHSHGPLPATLTARTGRGAHHVYRLPAGAVIGCSTGRLGEGIDIRGDGGYVIAAPSVHPSGTVYRWDDPALEVAPLPVWVSTLLGQRPERLEPDPDPDDDSDDSDDPEHPELDLVADTYARTGDLEAALDAGRELIDAGVATAEQVAATLALVQIARD